MNLIAFKPKTWYSEEKDYQFEGIKVYRLGNFDLSSTIFP